MGRDKAHVLVHGQPMARRVAETLRAAGATSVTAVGGDGDRLTRLGLGHLPDRWPAEGPLGGIVTALDGATSSRVLVVSCDLVAPAATAFRTVIEGCRGDRDVAVPVVGGRHQWLHAVWRRGVVDRLTAAFDAGERSVAGAACDLRVATVTGIDPAAVVDADTPADLPDP